MMNEEQKGFGLKPLPQKALGEQPDFSLAGVFGASQLPCLPTSDFYVSEPLVIKDQQDLDDCTGNSVAAVSEDQEGIELSEEYQFYLTKVLIEKSPDSWGANLRDACLSAVNYGSLPKSEAYKYLKNRYDRFEILNPSTWPIALLNIAAKYKKGSMFAVDFPFDTFTNIRLALWQHRFELTGQKNSVSIGCKWYDEWTYSIGGIIPKTYSRVQGGHAFKIFGQKNINGEVYLVAQLSNGKRIGNNGIFYFPKEVANKEFGPYGIFMLNDMPKTKAKVLSNGGLSVDSSPIAIGIAYVIHFFEGLLKRK